MLSELFRLLMLLFFSIDHIRTDQFGCQYNSTIYPIDTEWKSSESCQICKCLPNHIVVCRNRTCHLSDDCQTGEQLTIKTGVCCPTCSPIRRSCLFDSTAILHNTVFYPKSCLRCRCRDGQLFCDDICPRLISQDQCSFHDEFHAINVVWSPLPCVVCQCVETIQNHSVSSVCYIKKCPTLNNCFGLLDFIPGHCCPVCRENVCQDNTGIVYQNNDVWTRNNNCTHCTCRNGSIICTEEICPNLHCNPDEKSVRLPNSCCPVCTNRHMCRFYGSKGYQIYYEHDLWYTSACQYCTCRRYNRIVCKSVQCEHQFCFDNEIQEAQSDSCCVSCRPAQECNLNGSVLKEGSYRSINNCTLCTCTSQRQPECYSNCDQIGYSVVKLKASSLQRNHTIIITDSLASILTHSKSGTIITSTPTHSILFQFPPTAHISHAGVLLGIIHNSTRRVSYRLVLIDFNSTIIIAQNNKTNDRHLADELRIWMPPIQNPIRSTSISTLTMIDEENSIVEKESDRVVLLILIAFLTFICLVLMVAIVMLYYRRKEKSIKTTTISTLKRPVSTLSITEKFHTADLTTKVTLLTSFHLTDFDFGTDV